MIAAGNQPIACTNTVGDLVRNKLQIFSVNVASCIRDVLDTLKDRKLSAAAVYRVANGTARDSGLHLVDESVTPPIEYIGIISIRDIYLHLVSCGVSAMGDSIESVLDVAVEAAKVVTVHAKESILSCAAAFCNGETYHGISTDHSNKHFRMLAQSDFVAYILDREAVDPAWGSSLDTLTEAICSSTTAFVSDDTPLPSAMKLLLTHHAVPVISSIDGTIVETFSVSDLTGSMRMMSALSPAAGSLTVSDFLQNSFTGETRAPILISETATIREAASAMILEGVHRLWIQPVKQGYLPQVLSMTDVLAYMLHQANKHRSLYVPSSHFRRYDDV